MNINLLRFLATRNAVLIKNEEDFNSFLSILKKYGLSYILGTNEKVFSYSYWNKLFLINKEKNCKQAGLCLEFDVNKGISFGTDVIDSIEWYGEEPFSPKNLE